MTDLLTPEEIQAWEPEDEGLDPYYNRLYRAYVTLWDERDKAVKRVTQLEQEIGALMR